MEAPGHDPINSTTFPDDTDEIKALYNSTLVDVIN